MHKTILITGGCGFIGTNLTLYFIKQHEQSHSISKIIIIDNFITSNHTQFQQFKNTYDKYNLIDLYEFDISDVQVFKLIENTYTQIDQIFHLASLASPVYYMKYELETLDTGYFGTRNTLQLCVNYKNRGCNPSFLFTSTSEVYGDALENPQNENYYGNVNTIGVRSCYDESKRVSETLINTFQKKYNINTHIVRIFNTYGPHMQLQDGRIITEITKAMLLKKTLNVYGNGNQTRSLNYIDDTINMIVKVINLNYHLPINIGNDREITINELIHIYINVYKNHFKQTPTLLINNTLLEKDDPKIRKPCLKLNHQLLGTLPKTSLEDGLLHTLLYFSQK
jgi:nucleoside-diphosphate-sugar epimerase